MRCSLCGAELIKSTTTSVTDIGSCLVIIRNVPCYKCSECNEVVYTGDVVKKIEGLIEQAKHNLEEISVMNFDKAA